MPRNVRNFWLDVSIDGHKTMLSGGPAAKDGAFSARIRMRDGGEVRDVGHLNGFVSADGSLSLRWSPKDGTEDVTLATGKR